MKNELDILNQVLITQQAGHQLQSEVWLWKAKLCLENQASSWIKLLNTKHVLTEPEVWQTRHWSRTAGTHKSTGTGSLKPSLLFTTLKEEGSGFANYFFPNIDR